MRLLYNLILICSSAKPTNNYVNKKYNIYDVSQQTTDDLRVLKSNAKLKPTKITDYSGLSLANGANYEIIMPSDYLHLLNCICLFDVNKNKECWNAGDVMVVGATKLTADSWSSVVDDVYNQPTKKRPYYYVHNQNDIYTLESDLVEGTGESAQVIAKAGTLTERNSMIPTAINPENRADSNANDKFHTLGHVDYTEAGKGWGDLEGESNFPRTFDVDFNGDGEIDKQGSETFSSIEKPAGSRYANSSRVKVEIRCGRDKSNIFSLSAVQIDYVKAPQFIRLTQEQLDSDEDISQVMEFPDYVNQEIVNELVNLVMRKTNDPSLQAHM